MHQPAGDTQLTACQTICVSRKRVAVCCSVLRVAMCCVLQCGAVCCISLRETHSWQHVKQYEYLASVLQCVAVCCSVLRLMSTWRRVVVCCSSWVSGALAKKPCIIPKEPCNLSKELWLTVGMKTGLFEMNSSFWRMSLCCVLQCVAVCCSVLQCVAAHEYVAACCSVLQLMSKWFVFLTHVKKTKMNTGLCTVYLRWIQGYLLPEIYIQLFKMDTGVLTRNSNTKYKEGIQGRVAKSPFFLRYSERYLLHEPRTCREGS